MHSGSENCLFVVERTQIQKRPKFLWKYFKYFFLTKPFVLKSASEMTSFFSKLTSEDYVDVGSKKLRIVYLGNKSTLNESICSCN